MLPGMETQSALWPKYLCQPDQPQWRRLNLQKRWHSLVEVLSPGAAGPRLCGRSRSLTWQGQQHGFESVFLEQAKLWSWGPTPKLFWGPPHQKTIRWILEPEQTPQGCAPHGCTALSGAPICSARALRQVGCTDTLRGTAGHLKAIASWDCTLRCCRWAAQELSGKQPWREIKYSSGEIVLPVPGTGQEFALQKYLLPHQEKKSSFLSKSFAPLRDLNTQMIHVHPPPFLANTHLTFVLLQHSILQI